MSRAAAGGIGAVEDEGKQYEVEVRYDQRIPTADPQVTLSADVYLPVGTGPAPVLLTLFPYRKDMGGMSEEFQWFAERGYAGMLVDIRGTGSSDGARRPEFDPGEGDDGLAAISWAVEQPWCDGSAGMWGASYGAITTLRVASLRPAPLKAIIPLVHGLDPGGATIHPDGARGDFHALVSRGTGMLAQQLLPSLINHCSAEEHQRWRRRLDETEPVFMDFARHRPGDPVWEERVIDGRAVATPALCVGGWRDAFPEETVAAYERLQGPKKLLMGPWGHTMPHTSFHEPIDFMPIALRWWDHWLRGVDNGIMDEPPITVYAQGDTPGWRAFESWPPGDEHLVLATGSDATLRQSGTDARDNVRDIDAEANGNGAAIGVYAPDPTHGTLRGLFGLAVGELTTPQDQHDDDARALTVTSEPLLDDVTMIGRPEVTIRLSKSRNANAEQGAVAPERLVVRLTDVGPDDVSTLVTMGVLCPDGPDDTYRVVLKPIAHRALAGHRLRVAISDADFPRLTPLPASRPFGVASVTLSAPTIADDEKWAIQMPAVGTPAVTSLEQAGRWTITRDPVNDGVEVILGNGTIGSHRGAAPAVTPHGHLLESGTERRAVVRRTAPEASVMSGAGRMAASMSTGEEIVVTCAVRCTQNALWAQGDVTIDGLTVFSRTWDAPLS